MEHIFDMVIWQSPYPGDCGWTIESHSPGYTKSAQLIAVCKRSLNWLHYLGQIIQKDSNKNRNTTYILNAHNRTPLIHLLSSIANIFLFIFFMFLVNTRKYSIICKQIFFSTLLSLSLFCFSFLGCTFPITF